MGQSRRDHRKLPQYRPSQLAGFAARCAIERHQRWLVCNTLDAAAAAMAAAAAAFHTHVIPKDSRA